MITSAKKIAPSSKSAVKPATKQLAAKKPAAEPVDKKTATKKLAAKPVAPRVPPKAAHKVEVKIKPSVNPAGKANSKPAEKPKKQKMIRDSFNMPADDYALIATLKKRALAAAKEVKKSELLRAGLKVLASMSADAFANAISAVPAIKTGRPQAKK